jgi:arylsulfatase A-like enzyme
MHSQGDLPDYADGMDPLPYFMACIEAMDYQIGRFLESMPENERENTVIIFVGDNGTESAVAQLPYTPSTVKGSLYQGGVNTPLFISGPGVTRIGEIDNSLITGTDLFATIADIAGVSVTEINDSKSFTSLFSTTSSPRDYQYAEVKNDNKDLWAISNGHYKLIVNADGSEEMFDLTIDPYESNDLLNETLNDSQLEAKTALENELTQIRD